MLSHPDTVKKGFEMLVQQYSETLYWKIRHFVLYHEDADDVLQNVLMKAWMNLNSFRGEAKVSTWLYRIAVNESLDFLRKQKTAKLTADEQQTVAARLMADEYFDGDEAEALLQEAVASLPDVQRMVFQMRYYDNMKYSEMSKLLDRSEGALKSSYHIAVQNFLKSKKLLFKNAHGLRKANLLRASAAGGAAKPLFLFLKIRLFQPLSYLYFPTYRL